MPFWGKQTRVRGGGGGVRFGSKTGDTGGDGESIARRGKKIQAQRWGVGKIAMFGGGGHVIAKKRGRRAGGAKCRNGTKKGKKTV